MTTEARSNPFILHAGNTSEVEVRAAYQEHGLVVLEGLLDVRFVRSYVEQIERLIRLRLGALHVTPKAQGLDGLFNSLCELDRKRGGEIYDVVKELPQMYEFLSNQKVTGIIQNLIGTKLLQAPYQHVLVRIDRPDEDKYLFAWHQDYPYNMMSLSAVTVWAPLTDVSGEMGRLKVIPGSHREIQPVYIERSYRPGGDVAGGKRFEIRADTAEMERKSVELPCKAGDVVFFHSCLLHCSGKNRSSRSRWVLNARFGDLEDSSLLARGWEIQRMGDFGLFQKYHPDRVRDT